MLGKLLCVIYTENFLNAEDARIKLYYDICKTTFY